LLFCLSLLHCTLPKPGQAGFEAWLSDKGHHHRLHNPHNSCPTTLRPDIHPNIYLTYRTPSASYARRVMASYTGNGNGGPPSSSGYAPHAPSSLRQNYPHLEEDPVGDFWRFLQRQIQSLQRFWNARGKRATIAFLLEVTHQLRRNLAWRRLSSFPHLLVIVWAVVLLWGERWIFHTKVESCHWSNWEKWVMNSVPAIFPTAIRPKQTQEADEHVLCL